MTNFEKMKPALDMIFNDLDVDDFVKFLGIGYGGASCAFCNLNERCNRMMGDERYPFENRVSCEDVLRSFLEEEVKE